MTTIKVTEAHSYTLNSVKGSKIVGMTVEFDENKFDYECLQFKVNDFRPIFGGVYRMYMMANGTIELHPKTAKKKSIFITKFETIKTK